MVDGRLVVVDGDRVDHAEHAVLEHDVADGGEERPPVLVERDHTDHHEVVEVHLDHAARLVHEDRRTGQQPQGGDDGARPTMVAQPHRAQREGGDDGALDRGLQDRYVTGEREEEDAGNVQPEQGEDPPMALRPDVVGQRASLREPSPYAAAQRGRYREARRPAGEHAAHQPDRAPRSRPPRRRPRTRRRHRRPPVATAWHRRGRRLCARGPTRPPPRRCRPHRRAAARGRDESRPRRPTPSAGSTRRGRTRRTGSLRGSAPGTRLRARVRPRRAGRHQRHASGRRQSRHWHGRFGRPCSPHTTHIDASEWAI